MLVDTAALYVANALLVPADFTVEFVLVDRPIDEKQRDAGLVAAKPDLTKNNASVFYGELPDILAGGRLPNVIVNDLRRVRLSPRPVIA